MTQSYTNSKLKNKKCDFKRQTRVLGVIKKLL